MIFCATGSIELTKSMIDWPSHLYLLYIRIDSSLFLFSAPNTQSYNNNIFVKLGEKLCARERMLRFSRVIVPVIFVASNVDWSDRRDATRCSTSFSLAPPPSPSPVSVDGRQSGEESAGGRVDFFSPRHRGSVAIIAVEITDHSPVKSPIAVVRHPANPGSTNPRRARPPAFACACVHARIRVRETPAGLCSQSLRPR